MSRRGGADRGRGDRRRLAGCSIEDFSERADEPIYDGSQAMARVAAAAQAAQPGSRRLVLTARAENHLHGRVDLAEKIGCRSDPAGS